MTTKAKPAAEFWTSERCFISEIYNTKSNPEVSIARARVEPGVTTQRHSLSVNEWYVIEKGSGMMTVGDDPAYPVQTGDIVEIRQCVAQHIQNIGPTDLIFLCVCAPRFAPKYYTSLE